MGLEFIGRTIKTSIILSALVFIFGAFYFDASYSLGISIGLLFNVANVWIIMGLVKRVVTAEDRKPLPIIIFSLVKFPVLYTIGYFVLRSEIAPVSSFMIGFVLLFAVIFMKVAGNLLSESRIMKAADAEKGATR